jgi:hypothetical protein
MLSNKFLYTSNELIPPLIRNWTMTIVAAILCAAPLVPRSGSAQATKEPLKGSLEKGLYTSPNKDYQIRVPSDIRSGNGGQIRDEVSVQGPTASLVIFTNDFGFFYRVVSFRPSDSLTPEDALRVFHDIRDKKVKQTARGQELRVIDVEREGSETVVTSITKGKATQYKPDLVTANAIFVANQRIYHVTAGISVLRDVVKPEDQFENSRKLLDEFLETFKALNTRD